MTDIVERLRADAANCGAAYAKGTSNGLLLMRCQEDCADAADKIEVQRSQIKWQADEIERLRKALDNILHTAPWSSDDGHIQCIKEARAALQKDEGGMTCPHNPWDQEVAVVADGLCPLCLQAEIAKLREALGARDK